jgi:glycosyltransferase involved in cell wall biosynthesis
MDYIPNKIGLGITTYNSENYFKDLYNSIDRSKVDEFVVVNGGKPYKETYDVTWMQHITNKYPAQSRNDCINFLLEKGCEHIFLLEDDMIIKDSNIFSEYIRSYKESGLKYFYFVSTSPGAGTPGNRTPRIVVEYKNNVKIALYRNMCNEFTYHHCTVFAKNGLYDPDPRIRNAFDIDMAYRETRFKQWTPPFWWFPDIANSDNYIENNPIAVSRLQNAREDGSRQQVLEETWRYFFNKHKTNVTMIPDTSLEETVALLKKIKNEYFNRN